MKSFLLMLFFCLFSFTVQAQQSSDRYASWNNSSQTQSYHKSRYKKKIKIVKTRYPQKRIKKQEISPFLVRHHQPERFITGALIVAGTPLGTIKGNLFQGAVREVGRAASVVIGSRPQGCPHRFCGCALARHIFGRDVRHLWLAANWLRFPRAIPAPGMVAARHGHVFQLQAHVSGSVWKVWDANSGGGRIRIHHRSIAGFVVVRPTG